MILNPWINCVFILCLYLCDNVVTSSIPLDGHLEEAREWLAFYNEEYTPLVQEYMAVSWNRTLNGPDEKALEEETDILSQVMKFNQRMTEEANRFPWRQFPEGKIKRQFYLITQKQNANYNETIGKRITRISSAMQRKFSSGSACIRQKCFPQNEDLTQFMTSPTDTDSLRQVWVKWRDATGKVIRRDFEEYVELKRNIKEQKDTDNKPKSTALKENMNTIVQELRPLYEHLHAYVRRKLQEHFSAERFSNSFIPAHLLGEMYGMDWSNIFKFIKPYKDAENLDVTQIMKERNYTHVDILKEIGQFFTSLGLPELPTSVWEKSVFQAPVNSNVSIDCHGTAWDMVAKDDFRIMICSEVNMNFRSILYHEIGHVYYMMAYKNLPIVFRNGASQGFHEAVGEIITLSANTPEYLYHAGLLPSKEENYENDINYLMKQALYIIPAIPYSFVMDAWSSKVFAGDIPLESMNSEYWKLRCQHQGVVPPVQRSEEDFDPGAKYHVPYGVSFSRYLESYVLEFQIQQALCDAAGHRGPLYKCNIWGSKSAGSLFWEMLQEGASRHWSDILFDVTNTRTLDVQSLITYFRPLLDWLKRQNEGHKTTWSSECPMEELMPQAAMEADFISEDKARDWLKRYDQNMSRIEFQVMTANWKSSTNITNYNKEILSNVTVRYSEIQRELRQEALYFNWTKFKDPFIRRQFQIITAPSFYNMNDDAKLKNFSKIKSDMKDIYSNAKVCFPKDNCISFSPGIDDLMATSRDYDNLTYVWEAWRNNTGRQMKHLYQDFIDVSNAGARLQGFKDYGEYMRYWYQKEGFQDMVHSLLLQLKPLYKPLHAYVRKKLKAVYGEDKFPSTGHIPAHLLGNMWAQTWVGVLDLVIPYPEVKNPDITKVMIDQNVTVTDMFKLAERFFESMNMSSLPESFWQDSILEEPKDGRRMVCHASAWDFGNAKDFRVKMCASVNYRDLRVVYHELGHVQYYLLYKNLPWPLRNGANPGFHEAVGDVLILSITPDHLARMGFLDQKEATYEREINYLMERALQSIAFLPFGYLIDQWRWKVFADDMHPDKYNQMWWKLRCRLQGVSPPVLRTFEDFDPGAKYHIPANTPYIRYFVSLVLQYQIFEALCQEAGRDGPLHHCDIYGSTEAGELLKSILRLGASKPWPEVMTILTGQPDLKVDAILNYYKPLIEWLRQQNEGQEEGWGEECPAEMVDYLSNMSISYMSMLFLMTLLSSLHSLL